MRTTIVINDDDEDKTSRLTAAPLQCGNQSFPLVQSCRRPSQNTAFAEDKEIQRPLAHIFRSSSGPLNVSTSERQLGDSTPDLLKSATSSARLTPELSSQKWPSGREPLVQTTSKSWRLTDVTKEDVYKELRMDSYRDKAVEVIPNDKQSPQQRLCPVTMTKDAHYPFRRTDRQESAKRLSPLSQTKYSQKAARDLSQSVPTVVAEVGKGHESVSESRQKRPYNLSKPTFQAARTVPWLSETNVTVAHRQEKFSPIMTTSPPRDAPKSIFFSSEGTFRNWTPETMVPRVQEATGRPNNVERGGNENSLPGTGRLRLKLNVPKLDNAQWQDLVPVSYARKAKHMQSTPTMKTDWSKSRGPRESAQSKPTRPLWTPSTEVEENYSTESDSDDASVRMQRSIFQASAMYNEEPQERPDTQEKPPTAQGGRDALRKPHEETISIHQASSPESASYGSELGGKIPAAHGKDEMNLACETPSIADDEARGLTLQPERLSASQGGRQDAGLEQACSVVPPMATETSSTEVTVADELEDFTTGQDLPSQGPTGSNEHLHTPPNAKLLEAIFKSLVVEMRGGQEYLMVRYLSRARKQVSHFPGPEIDDSLPDPFAAAGTGSGKPSSSFDPLRCVRMESRAVNARNKASIIETQAMAFKSEAPKLPRYNSIVRLRTNVLAQNDKDLRYLPYFRSEEEKDEADAMNHKRREELLEGFDNRIRFRPEERKCAEQGEFWREHLGYFLEEVGCTCLDIVFYLLLDGDADWRPDCEFSEEALSRWRSKETSCSACGTNFEGDKWDRLSEALAEHKPTGRTLTFAGLVCAVFNGVAKFSIWHIVSTDPEVQSLLNKTEKRWTSKQKPKAPKAQPLCMLCNVFDCPSHGAYLEDDRQSSGSERDIPHERDIDQESSSEEVLEAESSHNVRQIVALPERPNTDEQQHRCGIFCVEPLTRVVDILCLRESGQVTGSYNMEKAGQSGDGGNADGGYADDETCGESCFWDVSNRSESTVADIIQSHSSARFVGWSQKDIIVYKSLLATCIQSRRGPCIMAIMLAKPCRVIFGEILFDIHIIPHGISKIEINQALPPLTTVATCYKDKHYWSESSQTYDHHKRRPFVPCSHSGQCHKNSDCTCWSNKVACEWICGCDRGCSRRFQGCRCMARGAKVCFRDTNCDCWVLNRECDPWLCGKCGVLEVLDPVNRHDALILKGRCKNAMIQRNVPKRTLKGPSEVHGWGLFAGTDIRANDFIGEYKGEVISEAESNRRGLVYHYRGLEYLFRLNREQEIDSSRAGNKMRFINNSERASTINVYAQTMLCNGVQRIGLFARRNLVAGEEMFFRYGYPESVTQNFWEKEDLEAAGRYGSGEERDEVAGLEESDINARGIKSSVSGSKGKTKKGVGEKIGKKAKSGGQERHAHFLDDFIDDVFSQAASEWPRGLKKRKRQSSPIMEEAPVEAGPSHSTSSAVAEGAESDGDGDGDGDGDDDEEYEYEDNPSDEDDHYSAPEADWDYVSDVDRNKRAPNRGRASQFIMSRQDKRVLQTAAARAASLKKRTKGRARETKGGAMASPAVSAAAGDPTASTTTTTTTTTTTCSPRSGQAKGAHADQLPDTNAAVRPYRGKKRGRPKGWKKGIDFK